MILDVVHVLHIRNTQKARIEMVFALSLDMNLDTRIAYICMIRQVKKLDYFHNLPDRFQPKDELSLHEQVQILLV
tara:strand:+ start:137 stop:361 length:225 start_codon:yes stop_codon:yes gene_type:complete